METNIIQMRINKLSGILAHMNNQLASSSHWLIFDIRLALVGQNKFLSLFKNCMICFFYKFQNTKLFVDKMTLLITTVQLFSAFIQVSFQKKFFFIITSIFRFISSGECLNIRPRNFKLNCDLCMELYFFSELHFK